MYRKIIIDFVNCIREIVKKKQPPELKFHLFFHLLSAIMYIQNVGMVTIGTTELIPYKFLYIVLFQKIYPSRKG